MIRNNFIFEWYASSRIEAIRSAYRTVVDVHSERSGLEALAEEIHCGTELLDTAGKERADDAVLRAAFMGSVPLALLGWLRARHPDRLAPLLAAVAPLGFGFMVGGLRRSGPRENFIPACAFRIQGGEKLCVEVCKAGTERFCAAHAAPIQLRPSRDDMSCTWTWSSPSEGAA